MKMTKIPDIVHLAGIRLCPSDVYGMGCDVCVLGGKCDVEAADCAAKCIIANWKKEQKKGAKK
jgi:hypothetical protein